MEKEVQCGKAIGKALTEKAFFFPKQRFRDEVYQWLAFEVPELHLAQARQWSLHSQSSQLKEIGNFLGKIYKYSI